MPVPSRPLPRVGAPARIVHFGGAVERARVVSIEDGGRCVEVVGEHGETLRFELNRATARFQLAGGAGGPRLELLDG